MKKLMILFLFLGGCASLPTTPDRCYECDARHVGGSDGSGNVCRYTNTAEFGWMYLWEYEGK